MPTQGYVQLSNQFLSRLSVHVFMSSIIKGLQGMHYRLLGRSAAEALANIDSIVQLLNLMSELRR
jgi:hypothetical protein